VTGGLVHGSGTETSRRSVAGLVERTRSGDPRAIGRLISLVENDAPALREIAAALAPHVGNAQVIGITGAPGVGKSTCTSALVTAYRRSGARVGVLAVDPSSPFSGGALLGDRVRMQDHATDPDVFIRSMATRGHLGGLAAATPQAVRVLDAAGCSVVLVETVGVGQSEVEIAGLADTTLVLLAPGMGDAVQVAKAGLLEVGDVYVVNKADRDGAERLSRDLRHMLGLGERSEGDWMPPIVRTVATSGDGIDALVDAIAAHRAHLRDTGELDVRRARRIREEIAALALADLRRRLDDLPRDRRLDTLVERVIAGELDPYRAADELVAELADHNTDDNTLSQVRCT